MWELPGDFVDFWLKTTLENSAGSSSYVTLEAWNEIELKRKRNGHVDIVPFRIVVRDVFGNISRTESYASKAIFAQTSSVKDDEELREMIKRKNPDPVNFPKQW